MAVYNEVQLDCPSIQTFRSEASNSVFTAVCCQIKKRVTNMAKNPIS